MNTKIKRIRSEFPEGMNFRTERKEIRAGDYFPPHWHDYFEFEIVLDGQGEHIYNHCHDHLDRGSAYLMSYYDFHELRAKTDMVLLKIQLNEKMLPEELARFIALSGNRFSCLLNEEETDEIVRILREIDEEKRERFPFYERMLRSLISLLIIKFLRHIPPLPEQTIPDLVQQAVAYVHIHFREALSLTQLAEHCAVTPNYLGMRFSRWMGVSFSDYVNTVRLRYACDLLAGTDLSVKEIAFSSGYHSVEHFEYIFKRKLSCTPLAFRRGGRQAQKD